LSYLYKERHLPNLFDILMNSLQALQFELGNFKAISADVRINPDLAGYTWMEFYKPMEFIEKGAEAAELSLPEIRNILAERLSAAHT
jgi:NTE family protein